MPAAEPSDDPTEPGEAVLRMRVPLTLGLALQGGGQRGGGGDLGVACNIAGEAVAAIPGINQLGDANGGSHCERSKGEQAMRLQGLSLLELPPIPPEHAKALPPPPAQAIETYHLRRPPPPA